MFSYRIVKPSLPLNNYVSHYWTLRTEGCIPVNIRTVPSGCTEIFFHRASKMWLSAEEKFQPSSFVCGITAKYHDLNASGSIDLIAVVFRPYGARAFFREPLSEFGCRMVALEDLSTTGFSQLADMVNSTEDSDDCIDRIERFLLKKLSNFDLRNFNRIQEVIRNIDSNTEIKTTSMAECACLSPRQFSRVFGDYVGIGAKDFASIIRFQRALYTMQCDTDNKNNLTDTALLAGYYDQSHMVREFKVLTGYTPSEYILEGVPFSDYFSYR